MGRGLSDLQKCILQLAMEGRKRFAQDDNEPDLRAAEVLVRYYGFTPRLVAKGSNSVSDWDGKWMRIPELRYGQVFSTKIEGGTRFGSAKAATSRALRRLVERGVMTGGWDNYCLTPGGEKLADSLSVNQVEKSPER